MSNDPLFMHTMTWFESMFGTDLDSRYSLESPSPAATASKANQLASQERQHSAPGLQERSDQESCLDCKGSGLCDWGIEDKPAVSACWCPAGDKHVRRWL